MSTGSLLVHPLPSIALVQSQAVDADFIETNLRSAGMRNPILRYMSADALIATLSHDGQRGDQPYMAMAIIESSAWKPFALWRDTQAPELLPAVVTFDHDHEFKDFARMRTAHAVGMLKPFKVKNLIGLLEPLRRHWMLVDGDGGAL
jgi:hypothetical protein